MADIASLGIKVTTQGATQAATELDKLATAGQKAADGVLKAGDAARKSSKSFNSTAIKEQREELGKLLGQIDPTVAALGRLDQMEAKLGKFRKKNLIDSETFNDASKKINESRLALTKFSDGANKAGMSAKQLNFATRGLPAQFTDIAVSLGSGQRPLSVLLQQGGQIKDMFGGIGPAIGAMGRYVLGLVNPFTLAAAAVVGLGLAWKEASDESEAFNDAIILTGNSANLTASDLKSMAAQLDQSTNATAGKASEVLAQVAGTGKFTADQINLVSEAAIRMQDATGKAIEETVKEFVSLKEDPVDAILKLNDSQHFLTQSTLDQIESLQKQGREADAAAVAIRAYADTIDSRAPKIVENLNTWVSLWRDLKSGAAEAFDEVKQGFRDSDDLAQQALKSASAYLASFSAVGTLVGNVFSATFGARSAQGAAAQQRNAKSPQFADVVGSSDSVVDSNKARAAIEFEKQAFNFATAREKMERDIRDARALGLKAGKSELEIEKRIAEIRADYKRHEPKGRKPHQQSASSIQAGQDSFSDMTARFQSELDGPLKKVEEEHLRRVRELTQAAVKGKVSHDDLAASLALEGKAYKKNTDEIQHNLDSQVAGYAGPVARAMDEHEARLRDIDRLTKEAGLTAEKHAQLLAEEAHSYDLSARAAERAAHPLAALLEDMKFELDMIGKSNAERAIANELRAQGIDIMSAEGQAALAVGQAYEKEAEAKQKSIELMDQFRDGAANALTEFVTGAKSAKEALKDFFNEMAKAVTRAIAEQWMAKLFGQQGSDGSGTSGGGWLGAIMGAMTSSGGGGWGGIAKGAAFEGGVTPFAKGGVVDKATMFASGGKLGVYGEAGPEAILPLHRGPDGKLGVRMAANDSHGGAVVNNVTTFVLPERARPETQAQIAQNQQRAANRATARNR